MIFAKILNHRIWSSGNPHVIQEKLMLSPKYIVWCALAARCTTSPYFFEKEANNSYCQWSILSKDSENIMIDNV